MKYWYSLILNLSLWLLEHSYNRVDDDWVAWSQVDDLLCAVERGKYGTCNCYLHLDLDELEQGNV